MDFAPRVNLLLASIFNYQERSNAKKCESPNGRQTLRQRINTVINSLMNKMGYHIVRLKVYDEIVWKQTQALHLPFFLYTMAHANEVEHTYATLADEESIKSLDRYLCFHFAYALLGKWDAEKFALLGLDSTRLAQKYHEQLCNDPSLPKLEGLDKQSIDIVIAQTFCAEQYSLPGICEVLPGDVVIDAGCLLGETSIYFSRKCGESGRVFAFEPVAALADAAGKNIAVNVKGGAIEVIRAGLGAKNEEISFSFIPLGSCAEEGGTEKAQLLSLDSWAAERQTTVDFIKMDIEGAELAALEGAAETIRKNRPKLALSMYHKPADIVSIPRFITSVCADYRFYLRDDSDVVLFAVPS